MTGYVALLRGVNLVGKSALKMADLKAIAEELGLDRPRTFIASGNLLFASDEPEDKLRRMLEERLQAHMGKDVTRDRCGPRRKWKPSSAPIPFRMRRAIAYRRSS